MLYAKTNPPYELKQHSIDVGERLKKYIQDIPQRTFDKNKYLISENIDEAAFLTGFLHDIGKANPKWQKWANEKIKNNKTTVSKPKHSAISSVMSILILENEKYNHIQNELKDAISLAILHHHTDWTSKNMQYSNEIESHQNDIQLLYEKFPSDIYPEPNESINFGLNQLEYIKNIIANSQNKNHNSTVVFTAMILYAGLRQSDWHESSKVNNSGNIATFPETLNPNSIKTFDNLRPYQKQIQKYSDSSNLLGLAGCGEGKTGSALVWGKQQLKNKNINRLVFAMPTRVTTNNLYNKLIYNKNEDSGVPRSNISLYHGATKLFKKLHENNELTPDVQSAELYQAPLNVTTVDHIVDTFVSNYNTSPIAFSNLLTSGIVFDEIHAYDNYTTQNVLATVNLCQNLGIPVYVMSATIPKQIQNAFNYDNKIISTGQLKDNESIRQPYNISVKQKNLTADDVRSVSKNTNANKIMVVKNTVREAQRIAYKLQDEYEVYYYSSEFSQKDRKNKELEISEEFKERESSLNKTKILVSTQICEISLDLSSDILLTDIAPIDAIFQRAGRVHRNGTYVNSKNCDCGDCTHSKKEKEYKIYIYSNLQDEPVYPYAIDVPSPEYQLLMDTEKILSNFGTYEFQKSLKETEKVYNNQNMDYSFTTFDLNSENGRTYFANRDNRFNVRDIVSRKTKVMPEKIMMKENNEPITTSEKIKSLINSGREDKAREYIKLHSVPVPNYWLKSSDINMEKIDIDLDYIYTSIYINLKYDYNIGIIPPT